MDQINEEYEADWKTAHEVRLWKWQQKDAWDKHNEVEFITIFKRNEGISRISRASTNREQTRRIFQARIWL